MDLGDNLNNAQKSLFRFEYLQEFGIASELNAVELWKRTDNIDRQYMQGCWDFVASKTKRGVHMQRVRSVKFPMTDYLRMELAIFQETKKFGDDIRIVTDQDFSKLRIPQKDFWLIDDAIALDMKL